MKCVHKVVDAIIFDLDGTLLNEKKDISLFTQDVISICKSKGCLLSLATARGKEGAKKYKELLGVDLVLYNNGAILEDHGVVKEQVFMDETTCYEIMMLLYKNRESIGDITLENCNKRIVIPRNTGILSDMISYTHIPTYKITVEFFSKQLMLYMKTLFDKCHVTHFSNTNWYRFSDSRVSKCQLLPYIYDEYGISTDNIMAFGDDENDLDLIKKVKYGIAMENSIKELKDVSFDICKSNNADGVAYYLLSFINDF